MPDEKMKRALTFAKKQAKEYDRLEKLLETPANETKKKKESILRKLVRLTRMAALGKKYKQPKPKTKLKIGGVYAAYARRTAAPKTK